jgi:hypothetical protein
MILLCWFIHFIINLNYKSNTLQCKDTCVQVLYKWFCIMRSQNSWHEQYCVFGCSQLLINNKTRWYI